MTQRWFTASLVALALASGCAPTQTPAPGTSTAASTSATADGSTASAPASPAAPSEGSPAWTTLCVVAPLEIPENEQEVVEGDEVWSEGDTQVRAFDGDLIASRGEATHTIFEGDVDGAADAADIFTGDIVGNSRWLVFRSADSLVLGAPWRLHVVDRQNLDQPARVIVQTPAGITASGTPDPSLRGDQLVWTEPVSAGTYRVQHADLASGGTRTLAEGVVQQARFVTDSTIVWLTEGDGTALVAEQHDLATGTTTRPENPLAMRDASGGELATDGEFWVLASVSESTVGNDLLVWWPGLTDPVQVGSFTDFLHITNDRMIADGRLGLVVPGKGTHVVDLRTGVAQRIHADDAALTFTQDSVRVVWEDIETNADMGATIPLTRVARPGECTGKLTD